MKIGLIPQVRINAFMPRQSAPYVPLGLLCLAGAVDRTRHDIEIIDLTLLVRDGQLEYNANFEKMAAALIHASQFDLVGFSTFSAGFHHTLKLAEALKSMSPSTVIAFGGPQATFCDTDIIKHFPVDIVVRGEGEFSFSEFLTAIEAKNDFRNILGITYREGDKIVRNDDRPFTINVDQLPFPAFDLYPIKDHPKVPIEGGRGCPFGCTYCATSRYWGRQIRHKSPQRIYDEMTFLNKEYDTKLISFADDTFTINRDKSVDLCQYLIKRGSPLKWLCSTRIDTVDDHLLKLMSKAGCTGIFYGIESGSPKIQKQIKKNIDLSTVKENVRLTSKHNMAVTASFIMGFPDETEDDLSLTLNLRNQLKLLFKDPQTIQLHVLAPDINTEITLDNIDRLEYDGFHSDQAGGSNTWFDKELILKYKNLFLPYYYIKMNHIDREFIKDLHYFSFATQLIAYWTTLYIILRDGDPLALFNKWRAFHKDFTTPPDMPENASDEIKATVSVLSFLNMQIMSDDKIPYPVMELFKHEFELMNLRGQILTNAEIRAKAQSKETISQKNYDFDPEKVIEAIRKQTEKIDGLKESPVKLRYYQTRKDESGPVIKYKKSAGD